jgi:hypothetical protein
VEGTNGAERTIGGGVTAITFKSIDVNGDTATASGTADVTATFLDKGLDGVLRQHSPGAQREWFKVTLVRQHGRWLISQESRDFVTGNGS